MVLSVTELTFSATDPQPCFIKTRKYLNLSWSPVRNVRGEKTEKNKSSQTSELHKERPSPLCLLALQRRR